MPRENIALTAIFFLKCNCNFHITGNGSKRMVISVAMLGIEMAMIKILGSRQ